MKLEAGKRYLTADGTIMGPMVPRDDGMIDRKAAFFCQRTGWAYRVDGRINHRPYSHLDLIAPLPDAPAPGEETVREAARVLLADYGSPGGAIHYGAAHDAPAPGEDDAAEATARHMATIIEPTRMAYTNWRGETAERRIIPMRLWLGSTEWHPEPQWLMRALDVDKGEVRDFALRYCDFARRAALAAPPAPPPPGERGEGASAAAQAVSIVEGLPGYSPDGFRPGSMMLDREGGDWLRRSRVLLALKQGMNAPASPLLGTATRGNSEGGDDAQG